MRGPSDRIHLLVTPNFSLDNHRTKYIMSCIYKHVPTNFFLERSKGERGVLSRSPTNLFGFGQASRVPIPIVKVAPSLCRLDRHIQVTCCATMQCTLIEFSEGRERHGLWTAGGFNRSAGSRSGGPSCAHQVLYSMNIRHGGHKKVTTRPIQVET
jgi:hypothetical protein